MKIGTKARNILPIVMWEVFALTDIACISVFADHHNWPALGLSITAAVTAGVYLTLDIRRLAR